jgi:hypothetical protein
MFLTDMELTRELDFFDTVKLLECDKSEKKYNIDKTEFYELIEKNKTQFDYKIEIEKNEEQKLQKGKSNEKDLIRIIKYILDSK